MKTYMHLCMNIYYIPIHPKILRYPYIPTSRYTRMYNCMCSGCIMKHRDVFFCMTTKLVVTTEVIIPEDDSLSYSIE